jgi:flagellin
MATRINTNTLAMNAARNTSVNDRKMSSNIEKLSSGLRINRAADDAAGLVISEKMRAQISGLSQAVRNTNDAINLVKTAEGALTEVHDLLRSMRDLAVHAASTGTNTESKDADQQQWNSAIDSIQRIANTTKFNGKSLLQGTVADGTATATSSSVTVGSSSFTFQIGANEGETAAQTVSPMDVQSLGLAQLTATTQAGGGQSVSVSDAAHYVSVTQAHSAGATPTKSAVELIDAAIEKVSTQRAKLGAFQKNTLESNVNSLSVARENIAASESAIRDTDMADEMVSFTKNQILSQASQAMLAQANNSSQGILQLLRG